MLVCFIGKEGEREEGREGEGGREKKKRKENSQDYTKSCSTKVGRKSCKALLPSPLKRQGGTHRCWRPGDRTSISSSVTVFMLLVLRLWSRTFRFEAQNFAPLYFSLQGKRTVLPASRRLMKPVYPVHSFCLKPSAQIPTSGWDEVSPTHPYTTCSNHPCLSRSQKLACIVWHETQEANGWAACCKNSTSSSCWRLCVLSVCDSQELGRDTGFCLMWLFTLCLNRNTAGTVPHDRHLKP